jgi:hypothetical protein
MPSTHTEHAAVGHLADQAEHAIRRLTHHTRPATSELAEPADAADVIAALAAITWMLPQLLSQLAHWLQHEHHAARLRVDDLAPLPDPDQTVPALTRSLQHASHVLRRTAEQLDTAHQHAAHLAATNPDQDPARRGQNPCRSVGPSHLTKRTDRPHRPRTGRESCLDQGGSASSHS